MARPDKVAVVEDVKARLEASAATLLTEYRGLTVTELAQLRTELRKANASYRIAKNTLIRRAADEAGMEGLTEFLTGPTALVFCEDDPVGPAKALKAFAKDHEELVVKGGFLDGAVLAPADARRLAELVSRDELLAQFVGLVYGALANTARLLKAPIEQQARLIQALVEVGGAPGAPSDMPVDDQAAEPAPDAEATEPAAEPEPAAEAAPDAEATEAAAEPEPAAEDNVGADEPVEAPTSGDPTDQTTD